MNTRTLNTIKGTVIGISGFFITYLFSFVTRTVFIKILGETYLGVQGLFSNILSLLSLTELGLGSAIMFSLYKPIADNDERKIKALMNYYKKAYLYISLTVFLSGIIIMPYLDFFINEKPDIPESINIIYLLYLSNSVLSYLLVYKQSIIRADQKTHIISLYTNGFTIIRDIVQIFLLLAFKVFIPVLITQIVFTFIANLLLSSKANKMYPLLNETKGYKLDHETHKDITNKIRSMFLYKIGAFVVNGTDNILISKFIGIVQVGLYSNYHILISLVKTLTGFFINAVTPSLGNVISTSEVKNVKRIFNELNFLIFWIYSLCTVLLYSLLNPFISLWIGEKFLLSSHIVLLIVINFYIYGIHQNMLIFRNALALYVQAKWKPVLEATVNLIASLILINYFGLIGVILGTTISFLTTALWIEPLVLFKHYLGTGLLRYFIDYGIYAIITALSLFVTSNISDRLRNESNIISLLIIFIVVFVIHNVILILTFHRSESFNDVINRIKSFIINFKESKRG